MSPKRRRKSSFYRGVARDKDISHKGYQAKIWAKGQCVVWPLRLETAEDAARVADVMALYLKGPDAKLNFDGRTPPSVTRAEIKRFLIKKKLLPRCYYRNEPARLLNLGTDAI